MPTTPLVYPFDPSGSAATNLVLDERHIISPPQSSPFYFVVPYNGPFFEHDLEITRYPSGQKLIKGVDYQLAWRFVSASRATARPVFSAISLMNPNISGVLSLKLRYLGGDWQIDETRAAELLLHNHVNPRITAWEQVQELPYAFPVIDHEWDLDDMVGASEVVTAIDRIVAALLQTGEASIDSHLINFNNPHQTTPQQIGAVPTGEFGTMIDSYLTANPVPNAIRVGGSTKAELLSEVRGEFSKTINLNNPFGVGYSHWMDVNLLGNTHDVSLLVSTLNDAGVSSLTLLTIGNMVGNRVKQHVVYGAASYRVGFVYNDVSGVLSLWIRVTDATMCYTLNMLSGSNYVTHIESPGVVALPPADYVPGAYSEAAVNHTGGDGSLGEVRTVSEIFSFDDADTTHRLYHAYNTMDVVLNIRVLSATNNIVHTHYEAVSNGEVVITTSEPTSIRVIATYYITTPQAV